jgi:coproporphyrinogen dehydrogenase HemZ
LTIYVITSIQEYSNELAELIRAFYPGRTVKTYFTSLGDLSPQDLIFRFVFQTLRDEVIIKIEFSKYKDKDEVFTEIYELGSNISQIEERRTIKNYMKLMLYDILVDITGRCLDWGALTGVRPTKIVHGYMEEGLDKQEVSKRLYHDYRVNQKKAELLYGIAEVQCPFFKENHPKRVSIYINIPICPTKCLFCSFPSATVDRCAHLVDSYITALEREMEVMSAFARDKGIEVETVYIGGGTPTSLDIDQLDRVLESIRKHWGWKPWKEYTVEGGRPDTMTEDKLKLLKGHDITRISVNPQTMNDKTLKLIGRNHSSDEIVECFYKARDIGFDCINMDIIIGLPGEGLEDGHHTMESVKRLAPDNLTVHTLAIKRASRLKDSLFEYELMDEKLATGMMDIFVPEAPCYLIIPVISR